MLSFTRPRTRSRLLLHCLIVLFFLAGCGQSNQAQPTSSGAVNQNTSTAVAAIPVSSSQASPTQIPTSAPLAAPTTAASTPTQLPANTPISAVEPLTGLPQANSAVWSQVATGLDDPVGMANAGDGSGRLFIIERAGRIRLLIGGQLQPTPYLDLTDRVGSGSSEQGLLGLAFHPHFQQNGLFFVNYTDANGNTVMARFHADPAGSQADPSSEKDLLHIQQPYANHNGGSVVFGPDGFLYLGLGDGGSQGDPHNNGQSTQVFLGKILRIDVDQGDPYGIPGDNPFANGGGKLEIWAYGLRNPWRFDFDPQTHDLYLADVGQNNWEEVDFLPAGTPGGVNFGWSYREGTHEYKGSPPAGTALQDPVFEYSHAEGGCSITGGVVYRGQALPGWQGTYLFGDYCSGKLWGIRRQPDGSWASGLLYETSFAITSFGRDEQGEVYLVDQHGMLQKLVSP